MGDDGVFLEGDAACFLDPPLMEVSPTVAAMAAMAVVAKIGMMMGVVESTGGVNCELWCKVVRWFAICDSRAPFTGVFLSKIGACEFFTRKTKLHGRTICWCS